MPKQSVVYQDCPNCGRMNVKGEYVHKTGDKILDGGMAAGAAYIGLTLFNPLLAAGMAVATYKGFKKLSENDDASYGPVEYRFACPNPECKHIWYDKINISD